jgi:hypothetical protein
MSGTNTEPKVVEFNALTEDEKKIYLSERTSKFYLTILICAIYGTISLVMLLLTMFTSWGQRYLYDEMLAFVVTFIIGTIIIIIYLANEIHNFKPVQANNSLKYDAEMCPDYWKLVYEKDVNKKDTEGKLFFKGVNEFQLKYKCEMDDTILKPDKFITKDSTKYKKGTGTDLYVNIPIADEAGAKSLTGLSKTEDLNNFKSYAANMAGYEYKDNVLTMNSSNAFKTDNGTYFKDTVPVACDMVYPVYLSVQDGDSNKFRCAYAKACGVTWTEAGCE